MLHYQLQEFPFLKSYLRARNVSKNEKYMFTNVILMNRIMQNTGEYKQCILQEI